MYRLRTTEYLAPPKNGAGQIGWEFLAAPGDIKGSRVDDRASLEEIPAERWAA